MSLPKNILFPVDFSDSCHAVWPAVVRMSKEMRVPLTLFHALDMPDLDPTTLLSEQKGSARTSGINCAISQLSM